MKKQLVIFLFIFAVQIDIGKLQVTFPDETAESGDTIETMPQEETTVINGEVSPASDSSSPNMPSDSTAIPPSGSPICECVTPGYCEIAGGASATDGSGVIQYRIFNNPGPAGQTGSNSTIMVPASTGVNLAVQTQTSCDPKTEMCCTPVGYQCGLRYPPVIGSSNVSLPRAPFGAFPWQGIVFQNGVFITSGALIDHMHFLTVAHNFTSNDPTGLTVRMGDWDLNSASEPLPFLEFQIAAMIIHPSFNVKTSQNNIAILTLETNVDLGQYPTIGTVCLPAMPISGIRCWVSGFTNPRTFAHDFQRQVDLPLIDTTTCQNLLRQTPLGSRYHLDASSFICAGGERGKDACTGDSGSPLVCQIGNQFYLTGLVAWGMDCAKQNIPGVYTNIGNYIGWIQSTTAASAINMRIQGGNKRNNKVAAGPALNGKAGKGSTVKKATTPKGVTSKDNKGTPTVKGASAVKATTSVKGKNSEVKAAVSTVKGATPTKGTSKTTRGMTPTVKASQTVKGHVSTVKGATQTTVKGTTKTTVKGAAASTAKGVTATTKGAITKLTTTKPNQNSTTQKN